MCACHSKMGEERPGEKSNVSSFITVLLSTQCHAKYNAQGRNQAISNFSPPPQLRKSHASSIVTTSRRSNQHRISYIDESQVVVSSRIMDLHGCTFLWPIYRRNKVSTYFSFKRNRDKNIPNPPLLRYPSHPLPRLHQIPQPHLHPLLPFPRHIHIPPYWNPHLPRRVPI